MQGKHRLSERLYAALLIVYPKEFREAYGVQMRLTFRDACRNAYHRGGLGGLLALWLPTLVDLVKSALEERARHGEVVMSKGKLIALSGPLMMLVGAIWLMQFVGELLLAGQVRTEQVWDTFLVVWAFTFMLSFIPLLFSLIGMRLRFQGAAGGLGRLGLALCVAGCSGVIASLLGRVALDQLVAQEVPWIGFAAAGSLWVVWIGFILFGADALRRRLLPRWNLLPLLLGSTIVFSFGFEWFGVAALFPIHWAAHMLYFPINGAGLVLLGWVMARLKAQPRTAVTAQIN